jgi:hypothetical protein
MSLYITNESADIFVTTPREGGFAVNIYENVQTWKNAEIKLTIDEAKELAAILTREISYMEYRMGV